MLSLPLISPQPDLLRSHHLLRTARAESPPPRNSSGDGHNTHPRAHQQPTNNHNAKKPPHNPAHTLLLTDEQTIQHRKTAIRNFGATWLRPPGVAKTLQAMREEEAEIAEQEEMLRQEQGLRDLRARQEVEEARTRGQEGGEGPGGADGEGAEGEDMVEERDLDADIPDADNTAMIDEGEGDVDVTFNEDSLVEGSHILLHREDQEQNPEDYAMQMQEEAELTGAAQDEADLGIEHERDLDDSVPEAGSYQHTDTELEDSSSPSSSSDDGDDNGDVDDEFAGQGAQRSARRQRQHSPQVETPPVSTSAVAQAGLQNRRRAQPAPGLGGVDETLTRSPGSLNLNLSSSLLESSFVGDSPVLMRGGRGGAGAGRRGRGRLS